VNHNFLVKPAQWTVKGHLSNKNREFKKLEGLITISWKREQWFDMKTQLSLDKSNSQDIVAKCKGHFDNQGKSYSFVLKHNVLGNIEGEGFLNLESIVQYYWLVNSSRRCLGVENFYRIDENTYHMSSLFLESHNFESNMEATLKLFK